MSVESAPPPHAQLVYTALLIVGMIAAVVASATIGIIVYNYVTRVELREPVQAPHATVPDWIVRVI